MLTSNDDDEDGSYKPSLDCIIGASFVDDWGVNGPILDRLMGHYRSWCHRRDHHCHLGHSENFNAIQVASQEIEPTTSVSAL